MTPELLLLLRNETPGTQHVLHFNNAGASLQPNAVIEAMKHHLDLEGQMGGYEAANYAYTRLESFYRVVANLIHANAQEIAFMENATRAWDMIFYSTAFKPGERVLTSVSEYGSNYLGFLHRAKTTGLVIDVIPDDADGQLDTQALENMIDKDVKLIAVTHVPTQGGLINPAKEIGKIANGHNIPYLLDATQSIGQMPIDVQDIGCDFLCATGRKYIRGPRGTGFLYASQKYLNQYHPPFIDLHSASWTEIDNYTLRDDARRFEAWECGIASKLGLITAIEYIQKLGITAIWERIQYLAYYFRQSLLSIPEILLRDLGRNQCGIVTFTCVNQPPQHLQQYLAQNRINVSVSLTEYARLDLAARGIQALVRASVHYYNTEDEIDTFCRILKNYISEFM